MSDVDSLILKIAKNDNFGVAADWAALRLGGLPQTESGFIRWVKAEGLQYPGSEVARKRSGRGGGWEYSLNALPPTEKAEFDRRLQAAQAEYRRRCDAMQAEADLVVQKTAVAETSEAIEVSVSAHRRRVMEARAAIILEIDRRRLAEGLKLDKTIKLVLAEAKAGLCEERLANLLKIASDRSRSAVPSERSVYRWRSAYADADDAGSDRALALLPGTRKIKQNITDLYPWLIPFLRHYAKPSKPSISAAIKNYRDADDRIGDVPSYDQVRRALKALKGTSDHLMAHKGREGPLALKARSAFVSRSVEGLEPGTIYTGDGKTFDAEVQHPRHGKPFRPEITTIIDVATRKAVGWSVGLDENAELVAQAILHAVQNHGIPAIFYADRGSGYKNKMISTTAHGLCARLGTTATHSLPYNSQARGAIERVHGTIWNRLAKDYPSYMGKDMDPEAAKKVFKESRRALQIIEGKRKVEDPKTLLKAERTYARLIISWQQFVEDVDTAIAEYNDTPHSSMRIRDPENGRMRSASPNEVWAQFEATGFQAFQLDPGEADDLYRPYEKRKTKRALIEMHTNSYFSLQLEPWNGEYVFVGFDIHDAQKVWVRQIEKVDGAEVPGPLICVAEFAGNEQRYVPVSAQKLAEENRLKGRLRRHQVKTEEIEAEARPQLEHQQVVELALPPLREPASVPADAVDAEVLSFQPGPSASTPRANHRNPFQDVDLDLAWDIVEAPEDYEIPHGHVRLMSALMGNRAFVDMMREVGLPLTDLADRLAAAQSSLKSSNGR
ncbi:Mu transposase C-terminal domain-containing protein [Ruegeria sp. ANG-R]|uniref:Mu transposase C-terminal domain-containing protein n=1 Tax=Ruegeria sp. ANG-R TaxID=1577903 RepID=UPI00068AD420|nr:Mu transposase C-terminal domain-containing protein [Ruegeria sp. ANG-R]